MWNAEAWTLILLLVIAVVVGVGIIVVVGARAVKHYGEEGQEPKK